MNALQKLTANKTLQELVEITYADQLLRTMIKNTHKSVSYFIKKGMTANGQVFKDAEHRDNYRNKAIRATKHEWEVIIREKYNIKG